MRILEGTVLPGEHIVVKADERSGQMVFERAAAEVGAA